MRVDGLDAAVVAQRYGRAVVGESLRSASAGVVVWAEREVSGFRLAAVAKDGAPLKLFTGGSVQSDQPEEGGQPDQGGQTLWRGPASPANLAALRNLLPNLRPTPLGAQTTSAGFGDRLGLATPGHVDALRAAGAQGRVDAIFAQQSIRENSRTGRSPLQVLDDATLGAFVAGWRGRVGADADHLKNEADIDLCLAAGYSFFTIDPGDHVNDGADRLSGGELEDAFNRLPVWQDLDSSPSDLRSRLGGLRLDLGDSEFKFGPGELERSAVKYGGAIAHVRRLANHLRSEAGPELAEIEVSVDETSSSTSLAEHAYLALEMRRLGIDWVSLAPRFVGGFEKGVDYQGDLAALAYDIAGHARLSRTLGPYKLSLHSGSDKFLVYPLAAASGALLHLKTAGTSYLEALRVVGLVRPELLHQVVALGLERFAEDVKSYHVSVRLERIPPLSALPSSAACALLEQHDGRQLLHVTFGSALRQFGAEIKAVLSEHQAHYRGALRRHFERHLVPLTAGSGAGDGR